MAMSGWARAGGLLILQGCTGFLPGELLSLTREDLVPGRLEVNRGNAVIALGRRAGIYLDAVAASTVLLHKTQTLYTFATYVDDNFAGRFPWWR